MQRTLVLLASALGLIAIAIWLWWACDRKSEISFLPRSAPAEWIVYPQPAFGALQATADLPAVFRRSFALKQAPASAILTVLGCRSCDVSINGKAVALLRQAGTWKTSQSLDVSSYLNPGGNLISVVVVKGKLTFEAFQPPRA